MDSDIKSTSEVRKEHRAKNKEKEKFNMGMAPEDDLKLRKERKLGRKRDRLEEALLLTEKRRKDDDKGKMHQNGDPDDIHHRDKHHHSREKSPFLRERERGHDKPYSSKKQYYEYNERYYD